MKQKLKSFFKNFNWSDLYLLVFFTPLIINPWGFSYFELPKVSYFTIILSLSSFAWIVWLLKNKKSSICYNKAAMVIAALWLLSLIISTIHSIAPQRSLWGSYERVQGLITLVAYLGHWFLLQQYLTSENKYLKVLKTIFWVGVIAAFYSFFQKFNIYLFNGEQNPAYVGRVFSTLGQPNFLGQFLLFPIWISYYFFQKKTYPKPLLIITSVILLGSFVLTENRASWLALIISAGFLVAHEQKLRKWKYLIIGLLVALFTTFIVFVAPTTRSLQTRFFLWQSLVQLIPMSPIFGNGLETITLTYPSVHNPAIAKYESINSLADNAHNLPLEILLTQGLFGILIFFTVIYGIIKIVSQTKEKQKEIKFAYIALIAFFITCFFSFPATSDALIAYTFIALITTHAKNTKVSSAHIKALSVVLGILIIVTCTYYSTTLIRSDMSLSKAIDGMANRDISKSAAGFAEALKINPHQSTISTLAGLTYMNMEESSDKLFSSTSLELLKQSLYFNGNKYYQDYLNIGQWLESQKRYPEALEYFTGAEQLAPQIPLIQFLEAKVFAESQDLNQAILHLEKFFTIIPETWKNIDVQDFAAKEEYRIFMKTNPMIKEALQLTVAIHQQNGDTQKANYYATYIK